jgi:hypothetical protein
MKMAKVEDEPLMSPAEMKPLLMLSKRQPVNCAIGMTRDKMGVILLDKKAKPRKMLALLKKKAAGAKLELDMASCRFGQAMVDAAENSQLVQFVVNKETSGAMRPKLLEQIKKAGFGKCEIRVDEGLDSETDEDGEDDSDDTDDQAAPSATVTAEPAAPATPAAETASDASAVTKRLTDLVKRMMAVLGSNPAGSDAMKTAAVAAQAALKSGDLATAAASADTLERLLDAASSSASAGPTAAGGSNAAKNGPGSPVFGKARATWTATRQKVESEIGKLHDELQATYKGQPVVADLEKAFRSKVEPMMAQFDATLSDKLDEVSKTTDPGTHAKLVAEAKQIITKYESFLASDALIAKLDDNPFVPLAIEKTLTATLTVLAKTIA